MYTYYIVTDSQIFLHRLFSCKGADVVTGTLPAVSVLPIESGAFLPEK